MSSNSVGKIACSALLDWFAVHSQPTYIIKILLQCIFLGSCLRQTPLRCRRSRDWTGVDWCSFWGRVGREIRFSLPEPILQTNQANEYNYEQISSTMVIISSCSYRWPENSYVIDWSHIWMEKTKISLASWPWL